VPTTVDTRWLCANQTLLWCDHALVVAFQFRENYTTLERTGVAQMRDVATRALCGTYRQVQILHPECCYPATRTRIAYLVQRIVYLDRG